jgi:hypothetical protein
VLFVCAPLLAAPAPAGALSVVETVNTTTDASLTENPNFCEEAEGPESNVCPLRAALESVTRIVNAAGAENVIVNVPEGLYQLSKGPLPIGQFKPPGCGGGGGTRCPVILRGAGAGKTVIDGLDASGILKEISEGGPITVERVTLRRGKNSLEAPGGAAIQAGSGDLTVRDSVLTENEALTGGAIYVPGAPVTVVDSSLTANKVSKGGGAILSRRSLSLIRSSVSGNSSNSSGGGLELEPGLGEQATIIDSTIAGNKAGRGGGIYSSGPVSVRFTTITGNDVALAGGGIDGQEYTLSMSGSILANNAGSQCADAEKAVGEGPNIVFGPGPSCPFTGTQPTVADPRLAPLSEGGIVATEALLAGSPAINAGGATCPAADAGGGPTDARGVVRPKGAGCDLGAFESAADASVTLAAAPAQVPLGGKETFTVAAVNSGSETLTGTVVNVPVPPGVASLSWPSDCVAATPQLIICSAGRLAPGETHAFSISGVPLQPGSEAATALVAAEQADDEPANDTASSAFTVTPATALPTSGPATGTKAPRPGLLRLVGRSLTVDRRGRLLVLLSCAGDAGQACDAALGLHSAGGRLPARLAVKKGHTPPRALLLASGRAHLSAGAMVAVPLRLRSIVLRSVLSRLPLAARLSVFPVGASRVTYPVRLVKPAPHKRRH